MPDHYATSSQTPCNPSVIPLYAPCIPPVFPLYSPCDYMAGLRLAIGLPILTRCQTRRPIVLNVIV